jgi:hypothetical protein
MADTKTGSRGTNKPSEFYKCGPKPVQAQKLKRLRSAGEPIENPKGLSTKEDISGKRESAVIFRTAIFTAVLGMGGSKNSCRTCCRHNHLPKFG